MSPVVHRTQHGAEVSAPADTVYRLLAEAGDWPLIYPRIIHAEQVPDGAEGQELVRIWGTADTGVEHWSSWRELDPGRRRISFRPTGIGPPLVSMSGDWVVEPLSRTSCTLKLLHAFSVVDDDPAELSRIGVAVDSNSREELAGLKEQLEWLEQNARLVFSFKHSMRFPGRAADVYDAVDRAVQQPVRACLPHRLIAYRQADPPPSARLHTACWTFAEDAAGVRATVRHTVVVERGPYAGVAQARDQVRSVLRDESRMLLRGVADSVRDTAERRRWQPPFPN